MSLEPQMGILDPRYYLNPKTRSVGIHGRELHLRAICFSALHLTDGRLSHEGAIDLAVDVLASTSGPLAPPSRDDAERLVVSLVRHGLLEEIPAGYEIHDWHAFYPSRETVEQRKQWRAKKRALRDGPPDQGTVPRRRGRSPSTDVVLSGSSSVGDNSQLSSVQCRADAELTPSAVADQDQDPGNDGLAQKGTARWFADQLRGSDARTPAAITSVMRAHGLPEAALHAALETVREKRPKNEPGYFIRVLQGYGQEARYSRREIVA